MCLRLTITIPPNSQHNRVLVQIQSLTMVSSKNAQIASSRPIWMGVKTQVGSSLGYPCLSSVHLWKEPMSSHLLLDRVSHDFSREGVNKYPCTPDRAPMIDPRNHSMQIQLSDHWLCRGDAQATVWLGAHSDMGIHSGKPWCWVSSTALTAGDTGSLPLPNRCAYLTSERLVHLWLCDFLGLVS